MDALALPGPERWLSHAVGASPCPVLIECRYVEQTDTHIPEATVLESVRFSARLRLPSSTLPEVVKAFVDEVSSMSAAWVQREGCCVCASGPVWMWREQDQ